MEKKGICIVLALILCLSLATPIFANPSDNGTNSGALGPTTWTWENLITISNIVSKSAFQFEGSNAFPYSSTEKINTTAPTTITVISTGWDAGLIVNFRKITNLTVNSFEYINEPVMLATGECLDGDGDDLSTMGYTAGSTFILESGTYMIWFPLWDGTSVLFVEVGASVSSQPAAPASPASNEIKVILNDKPVVFDQPPIIENGRTLVPLRAIFEAMGADVKWEPSTQTVTAARGNITITLKIGSNELVRNNEIIVLDVPAKIVGGRTLVPARAVAESFGADVKWIQATRTVTITE